MSETEKCKTIAIFMGGKPCELMVKSIGLLESFDFDGDKVPLLELEYNYDWSLLMPVVEKINSFDWVTIMSGECKIHAMQPDQFRTIRIIKEEEPLINSVFEACFQYSEWFLSSNNA